MSTPVCIFARTDRPVPLADLQSMIAAVAQQGLDGQGTWCDGPVALGHLALHETPEMQVESQPTPLDARIAATAPADVWISADVRLDNRTELAAKLQIARELLPTLGDSQLLLAAYLRWGEDCPQHLLGDFAFIIWDGPQRKLFCARDALGVKPLYAYIQPDLVLVAGDVRALVAHPQGPHQPDLHALVYYLRETQFARPTQTYLAGVTSLLPAHTLTVTSEQTRLCRYWWPDRLPALRLTSLDAAAEELRALLDDAVAVRLRRVGEVAAHMSGGLDSSSLAVLAARQLRSAGTDLATYSWQPATTAPDALARPEYVQLQAMIDYARFDHTAVDVTLTDVVQELQRDICLHHTANFWYEAIVRRAATQRGCRILLSGWGGDELISFNGRSYTSELFWRGQWRAMVRRINASPRPPGKNPLRHTMGAFYQNVVTPFLTHWRYRVWPAAPVDERIQLPYLTPDFAALFTQLPPANPWPNPLRVRSYQLALLHFGHLQARMQGWAADGADDRIVYRYPLLDRRIVELALRLPPAAFGEAQGGRYLFRRATTGALPPEVVWGNAKVEPARVQTLVQLTQAAMLPAFDALAPQIRAPRLQPEALRRYILDVNNLDGSISDHISLISRTMRAVQVMGAGWQLC